MWALPKRWHSFWGGVLFIGFGALTIGRGWIANSLYRDLVATGWQASTIGVIFVIMGAALLVDAYRRHRKKDETEPASE